MKKSHNNLLPYKFLLFIVLIIFIMGSIYSVRATMAQNNVVSAPANVIHIKLDGTGGGTSWEDATAPASLDWAVAQSAVSKDAVPPLEVWVAGGDYERTESLFMEKGAKMYGGFAGNETELSERDLSKTSNATILRKSKTKWQDKDAGSIVLAVGTEDKTGLLTARDTIMDGFTITGGTGSNYFVGGSYFFGGGLYTDTSNIKVANCTFVSNSVNASGGAIFNAGGESEQSYPLLVNCTFSGNKAVNTPPSAQAGTGSAIYNYYSDITVVNCTFADNETNSTSSATIHNESSSPVIINSIFWNNKGNIKGEVFSETTLRIAHPAAKNCVMCGDLPDVGTYTNIISTDPLLTAYDKNGEIASSLDDVHIYKISEGSSAAAKGLAVGEHLISVNKNVVKAAVPSQDQLGHIRFETLVDIGAHQYTMPVSRTVKSGEVLKITENTVFNDLALESGAKLEVANGVKLTISGNFTANGEIYLNSSASIEVKGIASGKPQLYVLSSNAINITVGAGSTMSFTGAVINGTKIESEIAVSNGGYNPYELKGVILTPEALELGIGDAFTLTARLIPGGISEKITYSSEKQEVAAIDANGNLKALAAGQSVITAKAGSFEAKSIVTVKNITVKSIVLSENGISGVSGASASITAAKFPSGAKTPVTWSSANEDIATCEDGKVTFIKEGETTITATADGVKSVCSVKVTPEEIKAEGIKIAAGDIELLFDEVRKLGVNITPHNATQKEIEWSVEAGKKTKITQDGLLTAGGTAETVQITAAIKSTDIKDTITAEVRAPKPQTICLSNSEINMFEGQKAELSALVFPVSAKVTAVTWSKTDAEGAIAAVGGESSAITITALKAGTATVNAVVGDKEKTCVITVQNLPKQTIGAENIELDTVRSKVTKSGKTTVNAKITPANAEGTLTWKISSTDIATVAANGAKAIITGGTRSGEAILTATWNGAGGEKLEAMAIIGTEDLNMPLKAPLTESEMTELETNNVTPVLTLPGKDITIINTELKNKIEVSAEGILVVADEVAEKISQKEGSAFIPLKVAESKTEANATAMLSMMVIGGAEIPVGTVKDLIAYKLCNDGTPEKISRVSSYKDMKNGAWCVIKEGDSQILQETDVIEKDTLYVINIAVTDNSKYDINPAVGVISDPMLLAHAGETPQSEGSSGSSGCNAGFGGLMLLLGMVPLCFKKKS